MIEDLKKIVDTEKNNEVDNNKKLTIWDKFKIKDEELASAKKAKLEKENLVDKDDKEIALLKKSSHEAADLVLKSLSPKIIIKKFKDDDNIKNNMNINQMIIYNNPLIKNVTLNYLVWAPCPYFDGDFFFARIVDDFSELLSVSKYIPLSLSLPKNQVVVEFFCLPENFKRYVVVECEKIKRFDETFKTLNKRLFKDSEKLCSTIIGVVERTWTEQFCNEAIQSLQKNFPSSMAQSIYTQMKLKADEYLEAAILCTPCPSTKQERNEREQREQKFHEENRKRWREQELKEELIQNNSTKKREFNIHFVRSKKSLLYLEINDWICYHDVMFTESRSYSRITGFSDDNRMPLLLATGEPLRLDRQIGKVKPMIDKETYDRTDESNLIACGSLGDFELKRI